MTAEGKRLIENKSRAKNWQRWGTYLPERQWGTVREDYSYNGDVWNSFPYEMAQYRAYRWARMVFWDGRTGSAVCASALFSGTGRIVR